jgi:hypothetical protein
MNEEQTCLTHGDPARWSYCGGFWLCEGLYSDPEERSCEVADDDPPEDDEPRWLQYEIGGEG